MEKIKNTKTSVKLLSNQKFNIVDLKVENGTDDFCFLSEDLKELLIDDLNTQNIKHDNITINYSLSYCQGDGFCFQGYIETDKARFKITHSGHYYHYNSKEIDLICLFKGKEKQEVYSDEFTEEDYKVVEELVKSFNIWYVDLCKEMENIGYQCIENQEEENILRQGFEDWKEQNDIISDFELYDIDYKVVKFSYGKTIKKPKGYVKICNDGDTNIQLYIKDLKIEKKDYVKAVADITEYTEYDFKEGI